MKGLALAKTGGASHTVILARSFGIPCVIEISDFPIASWEGQEAIVDGELGLLAVGLTAAARRYVGDTEFANVMSEEKPITRRN